MLEQCFIIQTATLLQKRTRAAQNTQAGRVLGTIERDTFMKNCGCLIFLLLSTAVPSNITRIFGSTDQNVGIRPTADNLRPPPNYSHAIL